MSNSVKLALLALALLTALTGLFVRPSTEAAPALQAMAGR